MLASPDARARAAADAIADFDFEPSSFAIVRDGRVPAVQFFAPGHGARAGGLMISLAPIPADSTAAWWADVRGTLSVAPFDSSLDRWERPGLSVVTRYDATGDRATLVMLDSVGRDGPLLEFRRRRITLWLDEPPRSVTRRTHARVRRSRSVFGAVAYGASISGAARRTSRLASPARPHASTPVSPKSKLPSAIRARIAARELRDNDAATSNNLDTCSEA